jgi:hypothetical protein
VALVIIVAAVLAVSLGLTLSEAARRRAAQDAADAAEGAVGSAPVSLGFEMGAFITPPAGAPLGWGCSWVLGNATVRSSENVRCTGLSKQIACLKGMHHCTGITVLMCLYDCQEWMGACTQVDAPYAPSGHFIYS